jgi:plastocyanin
LGFHTITYSKQPRDGFFRRDEAPDTYAFPERTIFGSGCGQAKPCEFDEKTKFASSSPLLFEERPIAAKIDLPPGKYRYFCQIHPAMEGKIQVVDDRAAVATQKQVDAQIASLVRADTAIADALFKADQKPVSKVDADGARTWQVHLGDTTPNNHVLILAFMPGNLDIAPGDKVHYAFRSRVQMDPHTVTFPTQAVGGFQDPPGIPYGLGGFSINFTCDPDDPDGGAPGFPALIGPSGPECPANLEAQWAPWMTQAHTAPGNQVPTPATYHDSGNLFAKDMPKNFRTLPDTGRAFPSTFDAQFPAPGKFTYECDVHVDLMTGSINVS